MSEENKAMVRRVVDEVINGGNMGVLDELFAPGLAEETKREFASFRSAFPDWREEIVELVAEGHTVAGRFSCSGAHQGEFMREAPKGRSQEADEEYGLRVGRGKFAEV